MEVQEMTEDIEADLMIEKDLRTQWSDIKINFFLYLQ